MSIATIAMAVFFLAYGIAHFWGFPAANLVMAIAALVAGIALFLGK